MMRNLKTNALIQIAFFLSLVSVLIIAGCTPGLLTATTPSTPLPSPTVHMMFKSSDMATVEQNSPLQSPQSHPTLANFFLQSDTSTAVPTNTRQATSVKQSTPTQAAFIASDIIYNDGFLPGWGILDNDEMKVDPYSQEVVFQGRTAIQVTPQKDFGAVTFITTRPVENVYRRSKVLGVSLWLNGGDHPIALSDLAFTVLGSNQYPYWVADDHSAYIGGEIPFSETRLYYLGFNNTIPSNTWVNVQIWMENLIFDPNYDYVTGFYIKNDQGFFNTFYIDDVSLLLLGENPEFTPTPTRMAEIPAIETAQTSQPDGAQTPSPSPTPSLTPTPTTSPSSTRMPTRTLTQTNTRMPTRTSTPTP